MDGGGGRAMGAVAGGSGQIAAQTAAPAGDWQWLRHYLQLEVSLTEVLAAFPREDAALQAAVGACAGLRLLRQEPWECLASFICSSSKQIAQIEQMIALLCGRFGEPLAVPEGEEPAHGFPDYARLAGVSERDLRGCKLGFRAPYLRGTAQKLAAGEVELGRLFRAFAGGGAGGVVEAARGGGENSGLRFVVCLWIWGGVSGGCVDPEGAAA